MRIVKYIFLVFWTLWSLFGIIRNCSHYKLYDWIIIIPFVAMPYLILWYLAHRKAKKDKKAHQDIIEETTTTKNPMNDISPSPVPQPISQTITQFVTEKPIVQNEAATEKLQTDQKMLDDSLIQLNKVLSSGNIVKVTTHQSGVPTLTSTSEISYIGDDKIIARTDGKEITDDEIPYLVQVGREEAIAKWEIQELTRLIPESYQIMQTTDNPETLCNRYNFIVEKVNELASIEQQGLFDANTFNQYKELISDNNFYNLILSCYQKYTIKAQSELKTQNGINNRISKFWEIIRANVSTEFYNSIIRRI